MYKMWSLKTYLIFSKINLKNKLKFDTLKRNPAVGYTIEYYYVVKLCRYRKVLSPTFDTLYNILCYYTRVWYMYIKKRSSLTNFKNNPFCRWVTTVGWSGSTGGRTMYKYTVNVCVYCSVFGPRDLWRRAQYSV